MEDFKLVCSSKADVHSGPSAPPSSVQFVGEMVVWANEDSDKLLRRKLVHLVAHTEPKVQVDGVASTGADDVFPVFMHLAVPTEIAVGIMRGQRFKFTLEGPIQ